MKKSLKREDAVLVKRLEKSKADVYFAINKYLESLYDLQFLRSQLRATDFNSLNLDRCAKIKDKTLANTKKLGNHVSKGRKLL